MRLYHEFAAMLPCQRRPKHALPRSPLTFTAQMIVLLRQMMHSPPALSPDTFPPHPVDFICSYDSPLKKRRMVAARRLLAAKRSYWKAMADSQSCRHVAPAPGGFKVLQSCLRHRAYAPCASPFTPLAPRGTAAAVRSSHTAAFRHVITAPAIFLPVFQSEFVVAARRSRAHMHRHAAYGDMFK